MFEQATPLTKRINELAKKAKTVGLTEAKKAAYDRLQSINRKQYHTI